MIQNKKMTGVSKSDLKDRIEEALKNKDFNLYTFVKNMDC